MSIFFFFGIVVNCGVYASIAYIQGMARDRRLIAIPLVIIYPFLMVAFSLVRLLAEVDDRKRAIKEFKAMRPENYSSWEKHIYD